MNFRNVKPTALELYDGNVWRDLGRQTTVDSALAALEALAHAGMENCTARLGYIEVRNDRRTKTGTRKKHATMHGTISNLINKTKSFKV